MLDAVVIGGGQAGLAASWHLARHGIEHVVLEQGRIGESWRSQRWDSFALNSPLWATRLPGDDEPVEPPDSFLLRDAWVARLDGYARTAELPVRTNTRVTAVEQARDGKAFVLTLEPTETLTARCVILASGFQRMPHLPAMASSVPSGTLSMHAADYRRPAALPPGRVLVIGTAQSGGQIAEDLIDGGREVYLSASGAGRIPRRYRGAEIFDWLLPAGFYDHTVATLPDPRMALAPVPMISGVGRHGHTLSLQYLAARGVTLVGRLLSIDGDQVEFASDLAKSLRAGDRVSAQSRALADKGIAALGLAAPPLEPDPADEPVPDPEAVAGHAPSRLDLRQSGISTVIWATGFGGDLSWVRLPVADEFGKPIHTDGTSIVPGIWFLGVPWLRTRRSGIVLGADPDGAAVADAVAAYLAA